MGNGLFLHLLPEPSGGSVHTVERSEQRAPPQSLSGTERHSAGGYLPSRQGQRPAYSAPPAGQSGNNNGIKSPGIWGTVRMTSFIIQSCLTELCETGPTLLFSGEGTNPLSGISPHIASLPAKYNVFKESRVTVNPAAKQETVDNHSTKFIGKCYQIKMQILLFIVAK